MDGRALLSRVLGGVFVLLMLAWGLSMLVGPRAGPPTSPDAPGLVGIGGPAPAPAPLAGSARKVTTPTRSAAPSPAPAGTTSTPARTVTLRGTVTDAAGTPVEGADVAARPGLAVHVSTTSDAAGRFSLEVPANSTCRLRARHRRVGRVERAGLAIGDAGLDVGPIVLVPAGILEGTVELLDGSAVPWGRVLFGPPRPLELTPRADDPDAPPARWGWPRDEALVRADRDGVFVARDLEPGEYTLVGALKRIHPDRLRPSIIQTVRTDSTGLRVVSTERVLVLHVGDESGAPVARGTIRFIERDDAGGVTDAGTSEFRDGIAAIEVDGAERLIVRAETEALESDEVEVRFEVGAPVRSERVLTVRPFGGPGHVRIEARPSPMPVRQYFVRATALRADGAPGMGGDSFVVEAGALSPLLRAGRWRLEVFPGATGAIRRVPAVDVHGGPPPGTVYPPLAAEIHEVLVPAGGEVTVQAADREAGFLRATLRNAAAFDGVTRDVVVRGLDPASGVTWTGAWSVPERPGRWRGLGADGPQEYSVPLAPGAYVLDVTMRGRGAASVPFEIRAGATTDVEVEIEPTPAKGK